MKMESMCNILEKFSLAIYPVRFRQFPDQDCIFIVSDIINQQLWIRMGSNQWKLVKS